MNRRGFFATLLAPVVAKCLPKRLMAFKPRALGHTERGTSFPRYPRPVELPTHYFGPYFDRFGIDHVNRIICECWYGNQKPTVLSVSRTIWDELWSAVPEGCHYFSTDPSLSKDGWVSFRFDGADVVLDPNLEENEMWFINQNRLGLQGQKFNAHVVFHEMPDRWRNYADL